MFKSIRKVMADYAELERIQFGQQFHCIFNESVNCVLVGILKKFGKGLGAKKERAKLNKLIKKDK